MNDRQNHTVFIVKMLFCIMACSMPFCRQSHTRVQQSILEKTLLIANQTEPQELDPHIVTGVPEFHILQALFEGLVIAEPQHLKPVPGIASSWEVTPDGLNWTFHLRTDARWSNGDTVRADDFRFSWQRILSPALGSEYAYMLFCIKGAEAFNKGELTDFSAVGVTVVNGSTLKVELCRPTPYFLSLLSHHSWFPVHPSTILKFGAIDARGTPWTRPENIVTDGAFTLEKWEVNKEITVVKNPLYYDSDRVALEKICFYPIENQQTEERAFRTGEVHITSGCPPTRIDWYRKNHPDLLRIDPYLGTYFYVLNVRKPPFDNPLVRRAFALSVDRRAIVKLIKGGETPAVSFTPPGTEGYTADSLIGFDTTEARRNLEAAGYGPGGKPFPPVELLYNTSETHHLLAQAVQQMWQQYLGAGVTLVNQEWKVYLTSKVNGDFSIARMGWIGDYRDPMNFLDMWLTGGGNNNSGWSDAGYDSLIAVAANSLGNEDRARAFRGAERILMDSLPIIPVYYYTNVYLIDPSVKGWYPNLLNLHNYKYVSLAAAGDNDR